MLSNTSGEFCIKNIYNFKFFSYNNAMKRKILMIVEYNGADFYGWQKQNGKRTVQGELE